MWWVLTSRNWVKAPIGAYAIEHRDGLVPFDASDFDYVISGHGPETEPAIDPATVVKEQRTYLEDLMTAVDDAMKSGTHSPDELRKMVKLPKYEDWRWYDEWLPMNIERIWAYYHMGW